MKNKIYKLRFRAVNRDIFEAIRDGKKKIETRAATIKYRNIEAGDIVILSCGKDKFSKTVAAVNVFKTISALLKKYKVKEINPGVESEGELRDIYYSFPGYKEKIRDNGLVALELK
ncbi:MAG: ASCH domain-containing protein [Patescibacteria group bacterium]